MVPFSWRGDPRARAGITKKEVVVAVLAIGGLWVVVIMLMFPSMGRGPASGINRCMNNLSSLGKGIAFYQSVNGNAWPTASTEPVDCAPASFRKSESRKVGEKVAGYGWLVRILPYMDEARLHQELSLKSDGFKRPAFDPQLTDANGKLFATYQWKFLQCPTFQGEAEINYMSNAPEYRRLAKNPLDYSSAVGLTNYVAISATHLSLVNPADGRTAKPNGVIYYSESGKGPTTIPAGDSNTIVLTETREANYASWYDGTTSWVVAHDPNSSEPVLWNGRWICNETSGCRSSLATSMHEDANGSNDAYFYRNHWAGEAPWRFGPSSMHGGGAVVHMYGDKRTNSIQATGPNQIHPSVYMALITREGGEPDKYDH
jgi:hypothetical protein